MPRCAKSTQTIPSCVLARDRADSIKATVILNRRSSGTARQAGALPRLFASREIEVDAFELVPDERALRKRARKAVKRGAGILVVGGGDGSMASAVDVLAHAETILGVLPLGTGNSFAQTLSIPTELEQAVDVIAAGRAARVDLGCANGRYFANFATVGLSAEIADNAPHALKRFIGPAAYLAGGIVPFFRHGAFRAKINYDGKKRTIATHQIVVASGRYFGRAPVTPDASIRSGSLALFTTTGISRVALARMYVSFWFGLQTRLPDAVALSARAIEIRASPKQLVSIDGNPLGKTPVAFRVAPAALRVFVPPSFLLGDRGSD